MRNLEIIKSFYNYIMIQITYIILSILIPFLLFMVPAIINLFEYSWIVPKEILIYFIIAFIFSILFFGIHVNTTKEKCNKTNLPNAFSNALMVFIILFFWMFSLDYFPTILEPFYSLFKANGPFATIIYKWFMIYAVVFILYTNTSFKSVKNTCIASLDQIRDAYAMLQKEINGTTSSAPKK